jgi:hypothetical protein
MSDSAIEIAYADSLQAYADALPITHKRLLASRNDEQFNDALASIVIEVVNKLERNGKHYSKLNEDTLSSIFVDSINGTEALVVTREEFTNGHVDITFSAKLCSPARRILGEAKIYKSFSWHTGGVFQLIGRYSTGREGRGLLLVYVNQDSIKDRMNEFRTKMDEELPCSQTKPCFDHLARWSFVSEHKHVTGEKLEVWHLGCNLYQGPPASKTTTKKSGKKRRDS